MKIRNLRIENFMSYDSEFVEFQDGITAIIGLNGMGKSTIFRAIFFALYGPDGAERPKNKLINRDNPTKEAVVEISFSIYGDEYGLKRVISPKNYSINAVLTKNGVELATKPTAVNNEIKKLLKDYKSCKVSMYARQDELGLISQMDNTKRKDTIPRLLGIDGIDKCLKEMNKDKSDFIKESQIYGDVIDDPEKLEIEVNSIKESLLLKIKEDEQAQTKILKLDEKIKKLIELISAEDEKVAEKNKINGQISNIKEKIKGQDDEIQYIDLKLSEIDEIEKEINLIKIDNSLKKLEEINNNLIVLNKNKLESESLVKKYERINVLKKDYFSYKELKEKISSIKVLNIDEISEKVKKISEAEDNCKNKVRDNTSKIQMLKEKIKNIKDGKCPTCDTEFEGNILNERIKEIELECSELTQETETVNEKIRRLAEKKKEENTILEAEKKKSDNLKYLNVELKQHNRSLDEINEIYSTKGSNEVATSIMIDHVVSWLEVENKKLESISLDIKSLDSDRSQQQKQINEYNLKKEKVDSLKFLKDKRLAVFNDIEAAKKSILELSSKLEAIRISEKHQEYKELLEKANIMIGQEKDKKSSLSIDIAVLKNEGKSLREKIVKNKESKEKRREIDKKIETLNKTIKSMQAFKTSLMSRLRPKLSEIASDILDRLSCNKYSDLKLDEDYNISVSSNDSDEDIDFYSAGEIDLINVALRLAISKIISNDIKMIALDEIFKFQDRVRKQDIMDSIKSLTGSVFDQIFIITHDDFIKQNCDNLIQIIEESGHKNRIKCS